MSTTTSLPEAALDGVSRTRICVQAEPKGGRVRVRTTTTGLPDLPLLRPMLLSSTDTTARISLVPEGAMLLAGDEVDLEIVVGAGARLDLVEPGGTVAYDMRGRSAHWHVRIALEDDASLVWHGEPFVLAEGAHVDRSTTITLGRGARLALRETTVLGRSGEGPGRCRQRLGVSTDEGTPVLVEDLMLGPETAGHELGGNRVVSSVLALGLDLSQAPVGEHRFDLDSGGTLWRRLATASHLAFPAAEWAATVSKMRR